MFASLISKHGLKVDVANNGKEAFDLYLKENYDCVFMDLEMPVQNGYDTTKQIRELSKDIPVIVITAHSTQEDRDMAFACGATDFVVKPISAATIKAVLEKYSMIPTPNV